MNKSKPKRVTTKKERDLMGLVNGSRQPVNRSEKITKKQIEEIKRKGRIVEIPADWV